MNFHYWGILASCIQFVPLFLKDMKIYEFHIVAEQQRNFLRNEVFKFTSLSSYPAELDLRIMIETYEVKRLLPDSSWTYFEQGIFKITLKTFDSLVPWRASTTKNCSSVLLEWKAWASLLVTWGSFFILQITNGCLISTLMWMSILPFGAIVIQANTKFC